jgi:hypothetical protein
VAALKFVCSFMPSLNDGGLQRLADAETLAEQSMTPDGFARFLTRNRLTHEGAAALLGRSRRQIEYYLKRGPIPRVVALACFGYEALAARQPSEAA